MKKTFLTRRNALLTPGNVSWGWYALGGVVLLLALRLIAPNAFFTLAAPFLRGGDLLTQKSHLFIASIADHSVLMERNNLLEHENTLLSLENQTLRAQYAVLDILVAGGDEPRLVAPVLARPPESPYDTRLIAGGSRAGLTRGMEAFAGTTGSTSTRAPIGLVTDLTADFARVTLFSAPGVRTSGWVGTRALPLTLIGTGAGTFSATIARAALVSEGDAVFVPGPGMLALGKVTRIDADPASPAVTLRITAAVNPFSVSLVALYDVGTAAQDAFRVGSSTP